MTDCDTIIVAAVSASLTTLAVHAVQAWRYRPRPVDPAALQRALSGSVRTATGTGGACTGPHACTGHAGMRPWCVESCSTCRGTGARPCFATHRR